MLLLMTGYLSYCLDQISVSSGCFSFFSILHTILCKSSVEDNFPAVIQRNTHISPSGTSDHVFFYDLSNSKTSINNVNFNSITGHEMTDMGSQEVFSVCSEILHCVSSNEPTIVYCCKVVITDTLYCIWFLFIYIFYFVTWTLATSPMLY